jgi:hypothetical protein
MLRTRVAHGLIYSILSVLTVFNAGCITVDLWYGGGSEAQLVETVVRGEEGPKILLVEIDGVIGISNNAGFLFGADEYSMVARVREVLDLARSDDDVRAILLRIDSPGGTATASEQIYTEIARYRRELGSAEREMSALRSLPLEDAEPLSSEPVRSERDF